MRLTRFGAKKRPFYRIVVVDSRGKRDGKYIDQIGYYDPMKNPAEVKIDEEKAKAWLDKGGIPSTTVRNLFNKANIPVTLVK